MKTVGVRRRNQNLQKNLRNQLVRRNIDRGSSSSESSSRFCYSFPLISDRKNGVVLERHEAENIDHVQDRALEIAIDERKIHGNDQDLVHNRGTDTDEVHQVDEKRKNLDINFVSLNSSIRTLIVWGQKQYSSYLCVW